MRRAIRGAPNRPGARKGAGRDAALADGGAAASQPPERLRLDKWLWHARFYKTRGVASEAVEGGKVRVNSARILKPGHGVKVGDVLTLARAGRVFVVEIAALGTRRGPASEAQTLYRESPSSIPARETSSDPAETETSDAPEGRDAATVFPS